ALGGSSTQTTEAASAKSDAPSTICATPSAGPGWRSAQPRISSGSRANDAQKRYPQTTSTSAAPTINDCAWRKCKATAVAFGSASSETPASAASPSIAVSPQNPDTVATSIAVSPRTA